MYSVRGFYVGGKCNNCHGFWTYVYTRFPQKQKNDKQTNGSMNFEHRQGFHYYNTLSANTVLETFVRPNASIDFSLVKKKTSQKDCLSLNRCRYIHAKRFDYKIRLSVFH